MLQIEQSVRRSLSLYFVLCEQNKACVCFCFSACNITPYSKACSKAVYKIAAANLQIPGHHLPRTSIGRAERLHTITATPIVRPPTAVPASRQHSVHQPCFQFNRSSHLERLTIHYSNSTIFQHLPTTPEDSSVLQQHRCRVDKLLPFAPSIRTYFVIWRATNADYLLVYLLYSVLTRCIVCYTVTQCVIVRLSNELAQRRRNGGGDGGARPHNVETTGARVSFRPRNIFPLTLDY